MYVCSAFMLPGGSPSHTMSARRSAETTSPCATTKAASARRWRVDDSGPPCSITAPRTLQASTPDDGPRPTSLSSARASELQRERGRNSARTRLGAACQQRIAPQRPRRPVAQLKGT